MKIEKIAAIKQKNSLSRLLDFDKLAAMAEKDKRMTTQFLCDTLLQNL